MLMLLLTSGVTRKQNFNLNVNILGVTALLSENRLVMDQKEHPLLSVDFIYLPATNRKIHLPWFLLLTQTSFIKHIIEINTFRYI